MTADDIINAIDTAIKQRGLSDTAVSIEAVGNPSAIKNLKLQRGENKRINALTLVRIAEVLGLEFYFGPPRSPRRMGSPEFERYRVELMKNVEKVEQANRAFEQAVAHMKYPKS